MSPNNPTVKQSLQVHAARLREMAESHTDTVESCEQTLAAGIDRECERSTYERCVTKHRRYAAALLAGAAALEAIEGAKAALKPFATGGVVDCLNREDFSIMRERIVDWHGPSEFRAAAGALAKLEAL